MSYLLDTCVLSEFTKKIPDEKLIRWIDSIPDDELYINVITLGEIQRGVEKLNDAPRKTGLVTWLNEGLIPRFSGRILVIDQEIMLIWGTLTARMDRGGTPMRLMDSLIAACTLRQNLILVTRYESDFIASGVRLINPWK